VDRLPLRSRQDQDEHHHDVDRHRGDLDRRGPNEQPLRAQGVEIDAREDADGGHDAQQHASRAGI
jgi:hypothetical protein